MARRIELTAFPLRLSDWNYFLHEAGKSVICIRFVKVWENLLTVISRDSTVEIKSANLSEYIYFFFNFGDFYEKGNKWILRIFLSSSKL